MAKPRDEVRDAKIRALIECGVSQREIARQLKVSKSTIHDVSVGNVQVDRELTEAGKRERASRLFVRADYILDKITDEDIEKASLKDKTIAAGILLQRGSEIDAALNSGTRETQGLMSGLMDRLLKDVEINKVTEVKVDVENKDN